MIEFNINSTNHLSCLLFGGKIKDEVKEPVIDDQGNIVLIKSGQNKGQIKMQIVEKEIHIKGFGLKPLPEWKTKKEGVYQTNEEVLKQIKSGLESRNIKDDLYNFINGLLEIRRLNKEISTYYEGFQDKIYPDSCIRTNFNTTKTATMRYSSNNPNLQNISK